MPELPPFSCQASAGFSSLLWQLNCSLAVSTYQAGKVILISAADPERIVQLPRTFQRAMGIAVSGRKMAIATRDEVIVLANEPGLAASYPRQSNQYDALYMPRATYFTGQVDLHDLQWGGDTLWAVNTSFSCIAKISEDYSWEPYWQPPSITELASEDRCHLNGMAIQGGIPRFVSALGTGNSRESWRKPLPGGGVLFDLKHEKSILENLSMPHSPRIYKDQLYLLLSGTGELIRVDPDTGNTELIYQLDGFVRGLAVYQDYAFIGVSRLRESASFLKNVQLEQEAPKAGIEVIHIPSGRWVGELKYENSVAEVYDVQVLPELKRPGILNTQSDLHKLGLSIPDATYWAKWESETR